MTAGLWVRNKLCRWRWIHFRRKVRGIRRQFVERGLRVSGQINIGERGLQRGDGGGDGGDLGINGGEFFGQFGELHVCLILVYVLVFTLNQNKN